MTVSTTPRPFVFVLMPFDAAFDDTYRLGIKAACEAAGAVAERVDEQIFHENILQRVFTQISKADVVVAEMTGRNANVFYETGYAHALGKTVVLLTREAEDIPFDLKHFPHIVYHGRIVDLRGELERRLRYLLENPPTSVTDTVNTVEVRINGIRLVGDVVVPVTVDRDVTGFELTVDLHNSSAVALRTVTCRLGLVTPGVFVQAYSGRGEDSPQTVVISSSEALHYFTTAIELLPGTWDTLHLLPITDNQTVRPGELYSFIVRVFTQTGPFDYPFTVRLESPLVT